MLTISRLTSKYQASIPKEIRKKLNISAGDYVEFFSKNDEIILKKITKSDKNFLKLAESGFKEWDSEADQQQFSYLEKLVK